MNPPLPYFTWRGKRYEAAHTVPRGMIIACPQCGDGIPLNGGNPDEMHLRHSLQFAADGAMTVSPSVVCPRGCGWHVTITNGVAS